MEFRVPIIPAVVGEMGEFFILVLVVLIIWLVIRAMRSKSRGGQDYTGRNAKAEPQSEEEALRRLCLQLEKMERRMANLETILMEKDEQRDRAERRER